MTAGPRGAELPPALAARPRDPRRGLPVPYVNVITEDGACDYTLVDMGKSLRCARERTCSLCGKPMGGLVAFIGGGECAELGRYLDPPMHPECGAAAMGVCPHMAAPHGRRRAQPGGGPAVPDGWSDAKTERYALYITGSYRWELVPVGGTDCPVFYPGPPECPAPSSGWSQ